MPPEEKHTSPENNRLHELLGYAADRGLTDAEAAELRPLLEANEEARELYALYMLTHADLAWERRKKSERGSRIAEVSEPPRTATLPRSPFRIPTWSIAAALIAACGLGIYAYVSSLPHSAIPDPTSDAPVATLIDATAPVIINRDRGNPGNEYAAGSYSIDRGSAQFMLKNRVTVSMRGRTRLHIRGNTHAAISEGIATFRCPPGTEGYTVALPDGSRVVDLGTAFRVSIDDDGRASVAVSEGRVRLDAPDGTVLSVVEAHERAVVADGRLAERGAFAGGYDLPFDTDAADADAIAAAYPNFTKPINANIADGVLRLVDTEQTMTITASQATDGEIDDFLDPTGSYTVTARIGAEGGRPVAYSTQLLFASNAAIEFGRSDAAGNEFFRVIALDHLTNRSSVGGIPIQVADIGFDIAEGELYETTVTVTRLADDGVTIDVTIADANSDRVFEMDTLTVSGADVPLLLGTTDTIGFAKRGVDRGTGVFADLTVTVADGPEPSNASTGEKDTEPRGPGL